jgi:hypothetical protein
MIHIIDVRMTLDLWRCPLCGCLNVDADVCETPECGQPRPTPEPKPQPALTPSEEREFADY